MYSILVRGNPEQVSRVQDFVARLWREVFGEPPPLADDRRLLGQILVESLPPAPPYQPVDLRAFVRRDQPGARALPSCGPSGLEGQSDQRSSRVAS